MLGLLSPSGRMLIGLGIGLVLAVLAPGAQAEGTAQLSIAKVDRMPNLPEPYGLRDWGKVARDLDRLLFDPQRQGQYLPAFWWDTTRANYDQDTFGLPSYIGDSRQSGANHEGIVSLGAVLGATLAGIDKSNQSGRNWVLMCQNFFNKANGENVYLNNLITRTGYTFWYELLPNLLFYQILSHYPGTGEMDQQMIAVADRWYDACGAMGGAASPWTLPDFNHTAFSLSTMAPVDNGVWKEEDAAAAIAWLEYMAYVKTGHAKYLTGARWGLEYLDRLERNPYYECLLPYGAYAAARTNAELDHTHNVGKMLNWIFDGDNWRQWGVSEGRWGNYDISGLGSSVYPNYGYAFAMNTFLAAGVLTPIARYDERYARAIGKWMLNVANASRLFYANGLPEDYQTCHDWAAANDPDNCLAYEGLRQNGYKIDRATADYQTVRGSRQSGSFADTNYQDGAYERFVETIEGSHDVLEHIWVLPLTAGTRNTVVIWGHCGDGGDADNGFRFSYATAPGGPYQAMFTISSTTDTHGWWEIPGSPSVIYIKAEDTDRTAGNTRPDTLYVNSIVSETWLNQAPYAMGDPLTAGWARTDFGVYGSVFVGMLGAIVKPTNVERILQLDLLATDSFVETAYPTYLYFNPYPVAKEVSVDVGGSACDLYESLSNRFLKTGVTGTTTVSVPAESAIVLVSCPGGGQVAHDGKRTFVNGTVIDYAGDNTAAPTMMPAVTSSGLCIAAGVIVLIAVDRLRRRSLVVRRIR